MKISVCSSRADQDAGEIVAAALVRSFTRAQVAQTQIDAGDDWPATDADCPIWINPPDAAASTLDHVLKTGRKAMVLGRIGPRVAESLGVSIRSDMDWVPKWAECPVDLTQPHNQSPGVIQYDEAHPLARDVPLRNRALCRFDFLNEWNNLGYGRIGLDGSTWSLQTLAGLSGAVPLAWLAVPEGDRIAYATLRETSSGAILWFSRPVGPVDGLDWRLIETFLGDYRPDELPCFPYVSEIPAGFRGAACARLDCDEAVAAGRPLFELYQSRGLPLSLAILTGQEIGADDLRLMREVAGAGGSLVSHSVHHHPNWGGSYEQAQSEAAQSRRWLEAHVPQSAPVRYAVSPFHQNPLFAVRALAESGYRAFVGGIIANDPEFLLGRAGRVPFVSPPTVSLSTQCMLHGDCYARSGNSIAAYCESFDQHLAAGSIFGYLDHPFSARYQYGWPDEPTRLDAHRQLIEHIARQPDIWWASLNDVLDFLCRRDEALVEMDCAGRLSVAGLRPGEPLAIQWKGRQFAH